MGRRGTENWEEKFGKNILEEELEFDLVCKDWDSPSFCLLVCFKVG